MTLTDLKARLKSGSIGGWYVFAGEEEYLKAYYRNEIKKIAVPDEAFAPFNHTVYEGQDVSIAGIAEAIKAPPMMSDYKLIEWRFADIDKLKAGEISALTELFSEKKDYPETVILITATADGFDVGTAKRPSKLAKTLSEGFDLVVFEKSTDQQLLAWMKKHFDAEGIEIDLQTLSALLFRVGHSMQMLKNEITKLSAYAKARGSSRVSTEDVNEVTSSTVECDAFAISNAIIEKNAEKAFLALADMKQQRLAPQVVLGQLARTYGELMSVALLMEEGKDSSDIEAIMKFHPYRLKLYMSAAKKLGTARISAALDDLVKTDAASKMGGIADYKAVEMFITKNI